MGRDKLNIEKDERPLIDKHYLNSTEWQLTDMKKEIVIIRYDSDHYTDIVFTYSFSRKPGYRWGIRGVYDSVEKSRTRFKKWCQKNLKKITKIQKKSQKSRQITKNQSQFRTPFEVEI